MRKLVALIASSAFVFLTLSSPMLVGAQFDPLAQACAENPSSAACQESQQVQDTGENPVTDTINNAANLIAIATAVISVVIIVYSGINMVLSQGESSAIKTSRDAIVYASVGLIVVAIARSIVVFIVNRI